ncbi:MAG: CDC27 family protein [Chthoniobacterales bacterium]
MTQKETNNSNATEAKKTLSTVYQTIKEGKPRYLAYGLNEEDMDSLYKSACNLYLKKDYSEALDLFKRLSTYNQLDPRGAMGMGLCFQKLEQYDTAAAFFLLSAEIEPEAKTLFCAASCFVALKNYPEAVKALDRIISLFQEISHCNDLREEAEEAKKSLIELL